MPEESKEEWEYYICEHGEIDMMCGQCQYNFAHRNDPIAPKFSTRTFVWLAPNHSDIAFEPYTVFIVKSVRPFVSDSDKETFMYTLEFEYSGPTGGTGITSLEERYLERAVDI